MDCPVCKNTKLVMSERHGIEIDYCPDCRGVWLDRGELDKIIDKSAQSSPSPGQPVESQRYQSEQYRPEHAPRAEGAHGYPQQGQHRKKKRDGFLGELFDF